VISFVYLRRSSRITTRPSLHQRGSETHERSTHLDSIPLASTPCRPVGIHNGRRRNAIQSLPIHFTALPDAPLACESMGETRRASRTGQERAANRQTMTTRQAPMFPAGQDSPLVSGTPMRARLEAYTPTPGPSQLGFSVSCRLCLDTGIVIVSKRGARYAIKCTCPIGQKGIRT
jgi:hypothetical protein